VFLPPIAAGMEQANDFAAIRIESSDIRSLEAVAMDASERKIIDCGWSAMLARDDVIDLEWRGMKRGWQSAIFEPGPALFAKPGG
jgi:hypothetical protein